MGLVKFRALVMGDGVPCYCALEIVGLLLLLLLLLLVIFRFANEARWIEGRLSGRVSD